jgi:signal transduction histidine kinase
VKKQQPNSATPGTLQLNALSAYATFLLDNKFNDFAKSHIQFLMEVDFPLLRYIDLTKYSEEQIIDLSATSVKRLLTAFKENRISELISEDIRNWVSNHLPDVSRDELLVEDITLAGFVRKRAFIKFLPEYTRDLDKVLEVLGETDRYIQYYESQLFKTFMSISNERISNINHSLVHHQEQLLEAQTLAKLGSFEWDIAGRGRSVYSRQLLKIFELDKITNMSDFFDDVHPGDKEKLRSSIEKSMKDGSYECEYRYMRNGKEKYIWSRGVVEFEDEKPSLMRGTVQDITERHHILRRLERNEELYKQAQRLSHIGNWTIDLITNQLNWSDEMYNIYELDIKDGITLEKARTFPLPEDRIKIDEALSKSMISGELPDVVFRIMTSRGNLKTLKSRVEVLVDENKRPYKFIGTTQDITRETELNDELKQREEHLDQLNRSLESKNKELKRSNEELSSFSYVASHDLQEPLRKIKTFSDLLLAKEKEGLSPESRALLDKISNSAIRMQTLIEDLLSFSRTQQYTDAHEAVDLNNILHHVMHLYSDAEQKPVFHVPHLPVVQGTTFQLQQLFENLIGNSVKYAKKGSPLHIRITTEIVPGKHIEGAPPAQNYTKISVIDNGIGFEQEYAEKIFEIFQRLHSRSEYTGTGIGLAICKRIVENHKGFIHATSLPGEGSVFTVLLPAH